MGTSYKAISVRQKAIDGYFQSGSSFWKRAYEGQDLQSKIYQARSELALEFFDSLAVPADSGILDIGCGAGILAAGAASRGYRVHAIDTAPAMLDLTRRWARDAGVEDRVLTQTGDICALPFPDASLEVVFALGVLPWVANVSNALVEVRRVLKPGAHLIITADNQKRLSHRCDLLLPARRLMGRTLRALHLRDSVVSQSHNLCEIDTALSAAGFETIRGKTLGFGPFTVAGFRVLPDKTGVFLHRILSNVSDRRAFLRKGGAQYVVLARRTASL